MKNKIGLFLLMLFASSCLQAQAPQYCQPENIPAATPSERFIVNDDGRVVDTRTRLMWKQCVEGVGGVDCSEGTANTYNWAQALLYMQEHNKVDVLGHNDWRIPNIRELSTLVESQCASPAVNLAIFPGAPSIHLWTSSPYHFYTHYSWYVDFASGIPTYDERIRAKGLRLVRDAE